MPSPAIEDLYAIHSHLRKKPSFIPKKIQIKIQKKIQKGFFIYLLCKLDPENMKKTPSKIAHNRPPTFFYVLARLPKWPRNRNPVPPKAP